MSFRHGIRSETALSTTVTRFRSRSFGAAGKIVTATSVASMSEVAFRVAHQSAFGLCADVCESEVEGYMGAPRPADFSV